MILVTLILLALIVFMLVELGLLHHPLRVVALSINIPIIMLLLHNGRPSCPKQLRTVAKVLMLECVSVWFFMLWKVLPCTLLVCVAWVNLSWSSE